jgi:hypothetical protein
MIPAPRVLHAGRQLVLMRYKTRALATTVGLLPLWLAASLAFVPGVPEAETHDGSGETRVTKACAHEALRFFFGGLCAWSPA